MKWFCLTCGTESLKKKGRHHLWCSFCERLKVVYDWTEMSWYEAEAKRLSAGREMSSDFVLPKVREKGALPN